MDPRPGRDVYTVARLNREVRGLLEAGLPSLWIEGELSNFSRPASGHWYFTLKDEAAQVRCVMFRQRNQALRFAPQDGMQALLRARVGLYEPRGEFQLIVDHLEEAGEGVLRRRFEALKLALAAEGLFDAARKRAPPRLPRRIGVVTSPSGAALRDVLQVLRRRFPAIPVVVYPVPVQGISAPREIAEMLALADRRAEVDVLLLVRGGGSLEDLWAFNEEIVARAIFASTIPIISAVGHETDVTIADFVADLRAATPSAAAEHATPDQQEWLSRFVQLEARLQQQLQRKLNQKQQALAWLSKRLQQQHPGQKLARNAQRMDELESRLNQSMQTRLRHNKSLVEAKIAKLWQHNPSVTINNYKQKQDYLSKRLITVTRHKLESLNQRLLNDSQTLHAVSPLATLNRGYALVIHQPSGQIIRSTEQLRSGDIVETRVAQGRFTSQIKDIE